jgi:tetratricopeptide (TPR) repeat protein/tRNA A-37 threonylcarbamoyl transferase component Bud32
MPEENLPERFGPYQIEGRLGAGGMGQVYRARDTRLGREVAVKVITHDKADDPSLQARFEREARAASALNHPNIVSVFDVGEQDGTHYIVTELVQGESLRRIISRGPVPADQLKRIALQIADALKAAHGAGIVHRDLKPENIMLTPDGRVKILDFGLARRMRQHVSERDNTMTLSTTTQPGTVVGTAGYMSPEQICGEEVDHRSDIFSAGLVLYEMAGSSRAFKGRNSIEVMSAVLKDDPPQLPALGSGALNRVIRRCMEKDPKRRYQTAEGLNVALESAGAGNSRIPWRWIAGVAAAVLIAAGAYWRVERKVVPQPANQTPATVPVPAAPVAAAAPVPVAPAPRYAIKITQEKVKPAPKVAKQEDPAKAANEQAYQKAYEEGMVLLSQRKWSDAANRLGEAIQLKPDSGIAYVGRCRAVGMQQQDQQAIADCTEAIRRMPDSADAYHERGTAYIRTQQFEKAIADMDSAIRLGDQNLAIAYSVRGRGHNGLKEWDAAIKDFDEAIRLNPNIAQFFLFRGVARNGKSDYAEAIHDLTEALRIQPNLPFAYNQRAQAKAATGDKEGAAEDRKQAKSLRQ